jgi:hypothetical protein
MFSWLALGGVWIALLTLALSATMFFYRPAMTDLTVLFVLYFGAPGALCFGGLVLWAHRKDASADTAVAAQRTQAKVAIAFALLAAAVVYGLIIFSQKLEPTVTPLPLGEHRGEGRLNGPRAIYTIVWNEPHHQR